MKWNGKKELECRMWIHISVIASWKKYRLIVKRNTANLFIKRFFFYSVIHSFVSVKIQLKTFFLLNYDVRVCGVRRDDVRREEKEWISVYKWMGWQCCTIRSVFISFYFYEDIIIIHSTHSKEFFYFYFFSSNRIVVFIYSAVPQIFSYSFLFFFHL